MAAGVMLTMRAHLSCPVTWLARNEAVLPSPRALRAMDMPGSVGHIAVGKLVLPHPIKAGDHKITSTFEMRSVSGGRHCLARS